MGSHNGKCTTCGGSGKVSSGHYGMIRDGYEGNIQIRNREATITCSHCNGTGREPGLE